MCTAVFLSVNGGDDERLMGVKREQKDGVWSGFERVLEEGASIHKLWYKWFGDCTVQSEVVDANGNGCSSGAIWDEVGKTVKKQGSTDKCWSMALMMEIKYDEVKGKL